jgi:hypothetical protein
MIKLDHLPLAASLWLVQKLYFHAPCINIKQNLSMLIMQQNKLERLLQGSFFCLP